ncbi:outer membrane protein [Lysobacter enzymogenes]|uniref:outer membrane protein n=1 Tax=Lysobacter enzymogenes TaxID=69 RepID=UPI001A9665CF|nr:outer membrane beta-barrel protein [Lysobacter enzymogenes]QQP97171.1 porin family protein [Lysobacter enzymogenes]
MNSRSASVLATAVLLLSTTAAAHAQDEGAWSGFYLGGNLGGADPDSSGSSRLRFDTNLDGGFGDTVRTAAGADAFSPGFCGGAAGGRTPASGCRGDKGGAEYGVRGGYDWQRGRWVFGVVAEYTKNDARDSVSAFSTTPAFYTMTRDLDTTLALRGRVGWSLGARGDYLLYATAGAVRANVDHSFVTSNTANAFGPTGDDRAYGWQAGIGLERKVLDHFTVGLEYLYTRLSDDDYRVRVGRGTAPATNPFLLVNPSGTDLRRADEDFQIGALRLTATYRF